MAATWRVSLRRRLSGWSQALQRVAEQQSLRRAEYPVLVFFHGDSLAHTIRPLMIGRALRERGYPVAFGGTGSHQARIIGEGFQVHPVETMPQARMDQYVARSDYAYYDREWIERTVASERSLIRRLQPALLIGDMRPALPVSAALEGVDAALVEAAYNQPGYPYPISLPQGFRLQSTHFTEFFSEHADDTRPHRLLYLVADIPEFHPRGTQTPDSYHYVGPLIDDAPVPRSIPELDDPGWDTDRPLIFLNLGSTGAPPDFLEGLLARLADGPYRALVTTAGRWAGKSPSVQIRLVDFLPANWVLRRASLFVGVGGIGSIYHALRQGVPIVGAPEHLDQEYHLNRVRDLGLGVKLDWEDFCQSMPLVRAIDDVFGRYRELKQRCEAFAPYVAAWSGGAAVASVIDGHFICQQVPHQIPLGYLAPETEFLRHLRLSSPPSLTVKELQHLLHRSIRRGMPHRRQGGLLFFDRAESWNWLYDHEPDFFEEDYRCMAEKRQAFFARRNGGVQARRESQRYRLTYRFRVYPQTLAGGCPVYLFLPYPIPGMHQPRVALEACSPSDLKDSLVPRAGFFYGYPVRWTGGGSDPLEYSYTCQVTVMARSMCPAEAPQALSPSEARKWTQVEPVLAETAAVRQFLHEQEVDDGLSPLERARRIYQGLVSKKRFRRTKDSCQCPSCSTHAILAAEGGHCITLSNAFIALCRIAEVPAREVTGALAGYPTAEGRYEVAVLNEMIFGHTWAEVFVAEYGWLPVEFHGIVIAAQAMTGDNVRDQSLAEYIVGAGGAYLDYYFGNLDCHRVICSSSVKRLPQLVAFEGDSPAGGTFSLPPDARYECSLAFEFA